MKAAPGTTPTRPTRRARWAAALGVAVALVLAGCAGGGAGGVAGESTLRFAVALPAHWDPVVSGSGAQFRILSLVYASLTDIDEKGKAVPSLAQSWDYNATGDQVTFHLRPNLKFSDGTPLNADAVKQYLERAKTQKNSALFGDLTSIKSVTAQGDQDVVINLTQVDYQIPLLLGERVAQITSPTAAADPAKLDQSPVGAGPFVVTENVPGAHVYLKKNPNFWDAANIHIDRVEVDAAPDPSTLVSSIKTGVYDLAIPGPVPGQGRQGGRAGRGVPAGLQRREPQPQHQQEAVRQPEGRRRGPVRGQPAGVHRQGHLRVRQGHRPAVPARVRRLRRPVGGPLPLYDRRRPSSCSPRPATPRTRSSSTW